MEARLPTEFASEDLDYYGAEEDQSSINIATSSNLVVPAAIDSETKIKATNSDLSQ